MDIGICVLFIQKISIDKPHKRLHNGTVGLPGKFTGFKADVLTIVQG
jgi:hypothetical protein